MKVTSQGRPYVYGALSGLLLTASVGIVDQFFGTSTTFPRAATGVFQVLGFDLSGWEFAQVRDGALTGLALPNWQLLFVIGIGLGAFIAAKVSGTFKSEALPPMWVERFGENKGKRIAYSIVGGIIAMVGVRMAGGCPSGHGISGMSQLGVSSLIALVMFFVGGVVTARILYRGGTA
ncbi:MAG: YeeE/YedE thiosulfate transporter family protein [Alkalispirochaetaceae bacterium]